MSTLGSSGKVSSVGFEFTAKAFPIVDLTFSDMMRTLSNRFVSKDSGLQSDEG
jgi:hypothetical protein